MEKHVYEAIKGSLGKYQSSSMNYIVYEDVAGYEALHLDERLVLLAGQEGGCNKFHWAASEPAELLDAILKTGVKGAVSFVPPGWVAEFQKRGFEVCGKFNDYFHNDIARVPEPAEPAELLGDKDCGEAADVTAACRGQSRKFEGETEEWMRMWISGTEPYAMDIGAKDCAVIIRRVCGKIAGIACVGIYGHASEKGEVLWLREIAVRPEFQHRGIATQLIGQALYYGRERGARRAFLMADEMNDTAIRLYQRAGFECNSDDGQIDMILR